MLWKPNLANFYLHGREDQQEFSCDSRKNSSISFDHTSYKKWTKNNWDQQSQFSIADAKYGSGVNPLFFTTESDYRSSEKSFSQSTRSLDLSNIGSRKISIISVDNNSCKKWKKDTWDQRTQFPTVECDYVSGKTSLSQTKWTLNSSNNDSRKISTSSDDNNSCKKWKKDTWDQQNQFPTVEWDYGSGKTSPSQSKCTLNSSNNDSRKISTSSDDNNSCKKWKKDTWDQQNQFPTVEWDYGSGKTSPSQSKCTLNSSNNDSRKISISSEDQISWKKWPKQEWDERSHMSSAESRNRSGASFLPCTAEFGNKFSANSLFSTVESRYGPDASSLYPSAWSLNPSCFESISRVENELFPSVKLISHPLGPISIEPQDQQLEKIRTKHQRIQPTRLEQVIEEDELARDNRYNDTSIENNSRQSFFSYSQPRQEKFENYYAYEKSCSKNLLKPIEKETVGRKIEKGPIFGLKNVQQSLPSSENFFSNDSIAFTGLSNLQKEEIKKREEKRKVEHMEMRENGVTFRKYVPESKPTLVEIEEAVNYLKSREAHKHEKQKKSLLGKACSILGIQKKPIKSKYSKLILEPTCIANLPGEVLTIIAMNRWNNAHSKNQKTVMASNESATDDLIQHNSNNSNGCQSSDKIDSKWNDLKSRQGGGGNKGDMARRHEFGPPVEVNPVIPLGRLFFLDSPDTKIPPGRKMTREGLFRFLYKLVGNFNTDRNMSDSIVLMHPQFTVDFLNRVKNVEKGSKQKKRKARKDSQENSKKSEVDKELLNPDIKMSPGEIVRYYGCFVGPSGQINRATVPVFRNAHFLLIHFGRDADDKVHAHIMDSKLSGSNGGYLSDEEAQLIGGQLFNVPPQDVLPTWADGNKIPYQSNNYDCGPHTILSAEACLRDSRFNPDIKRLSSTRNPDGETINQVRARVGSMLQRLYKNDNELLPNLEGIEINDEFLLERNENINVLRPESSPASTNIMPSSLFEEVPADSHGDVNQWVTRGPRINPELNFWIMSHLFLMDENDISTFEADNWLSESSMFPLLFQMVGDYNTNRPEAEQFSLVHPDFVRMFYNEYQDMNRTIAEVMPFFEAFANARTPHRIMIPLIERHSPHYVLLVIGLDKQGTVRMQVLDSLHHSEENFPDHEIRPIAEHFFGSNRQFLIERATEEQAFHQNNGFDCGVHLLLNAQRYLKSQCTRLGPLPETMNLGKQSNPDILFHRRNFQTELRGIYERIPPHLRLTTAELETENRNDSIEVNTFSDAETTVTQVSASQSDRSHNRRCVEKKQSYGKTTRIEGFSDPLGHAIQESTQTVGREVHDFTTHNASFRENRSSVEKKTENNEIQSLKDRKRKSTDDANIMSKSESEENNNEAVHSSNNQHRKKGKFAKKKFENPIAGEGANLEQDPKMNQIQQNNERKWTSADNNTFSIAEAEETSNSTSKILNYRRDQKGKFARVETEEPVTYEGTIKKQEPDAAQKPTSELKTAQTILCDVNEVIRSTTDRNILKALERAKVILQEVIDPSPEESPDFLSPASSEYSPVKPARRKRWLTEEQKKKLVDSYDNGNLLLKELIRVYGLSSDEKSARVQILRIKNQIEKQTPNKQQAFFQLNERVGKMLEYTDEVEQVEIHERDIQRLGVQQAPVFGLKNFKGSKKWVDRIKKRNNLVSRHIDKRITTSKRSKSPTPEEKVKKFLATEVPRIKKKYSPSKIFNVDQTGVRYELTSNRTITKRGRQKVARVAQSEYGIKHSFTANPCISASGELIGKTFVNLSEPNTPQSFRQMVAPFTELHVTRTKSGVMTSELAIEWLTKDFLPFVPSNSCLLVDSWYGFNQMMQLPVVKQKKLEIVVFPKKTTDKLQPLDLSFNRQFKSFIRTLENHIRNHEKSITIAQRATKLKIITFTMNQFKADIFKGLIQKGFHDIGLIDQYQPFDSPTGYCYDQLVTANKKCSSCQSTAFLRCAHCPDVLCASCALNHLH